MLSLVGLFGFKTVMLSLVGLFGYEDSTVMSCSSVSV